MLRWPEFKNAAPEIAAVGTTRLYNPDAGEVAILATVDARNRPWLAPFCPIFTDRGLYLLAAAHTPKVRHLQSNPRYALHALSGADDLEFQTSGSVRCVDDDAERTEVIAAIPFPSFDQTDPIFEVLIERALTVIWPEPGKQRKLMWSVDQRVNKRIASLKELGLNRDEYSIDLLANGTELLIEFATPEETEIVRAAAAREGLSIESYILRLVTQADDG